MIKFTPTQIHAFQLSVYQEVAMMLNANELMPRYAVCVGDKGIIDGYAYQRQFCELHAISHGELIARKEIGNLADIVTSQTLISVTVTLKDVHEPFVEGELHEFLYAEFEKSIKKFCN